MEEDALSMADAIEATPRFVIRRHEDGLSIQLAEDIDTDERLLTIDEAVLIVNRFAEQGNMIEVTV